MAPHKKTLQMGTVSELAHALGLPPESLKDLANRAPQLYRTWSKPKRSGGERTYREPSPNLKKVQRKLNALLNTLFYPPSFHGARPHRSNITNAAVHQGQPVIVKADLKDFFPSIQPERVYQTLVQEQRCSPEVALLITQLVTVDNQLPQGAPTSTNIAALVTFRLQRRLQGLAVQRRLNFTLYVDDVTFSGSGKLEEFHVYIRKVTESEGFYGKRSKEQIATKSHEQTVTGINIGHGFGISRKRRRTWRLEILNARKDHAIGSEALTKAENRFAARLKYAATVKAAGEKKC